LNRQWGVNAKHPLYHRDGTFYEHLEEFPGALFDAEGYVLFDTEEAYRQCPYLHIGVKVNVPEGIRSIPGYIRRRTPQDSPEIAQLKRELDLLQSHTQPQTPEVLRMIQRVLKTYERPSPVTRYVKRVRGATCQLCGELGFVKRNGKRYCEVHHLFHLSKSPPPKCLAPEYLVVLCATCHRRMHYADVGEPVRDGDGWRVRVDDAEHRFATG
jgi:5-methylcytosine-specific restriction protein A